MPDETITNPPAPQEPAASQPNPAQDRIKQLSEKVEFTSKERDEFKTLNETLSRENAFLTGFSNVVAANPSAKEHQDAIKEKVLKGYTVEDATFAVLGAAGKLGNQPTQPAQVAGGSADTAMAQVQKEAKDMSQSERREILAKELIWS